MAMRIRRTVKIAPGVRLNFSKSGVSTSLGGRGATVNVSKRGVKGTVGIPGSGISYQTPIYKPTSAVTKSQGQSDQNVPTAASNTSAQPGLKTAIFVVVALILLINYVYP